MKTRWIVMSLCAAMLLAVDGLKAAKEESVTKEFKATCPVSGKPAGEDHVVKLRNGDKVYFCCDNCPKEFEANPRKYMLKVRRQLLETGQVVQVACPFTGKPVNKETLVDVGDAKAGFCCKNCAAKYAKADDAEKLKMMFSPAAFKKGFTHQVKCPVSGKPINPDDFVEYKGKKVYFCCPHCPEAFKADPEKYLAKLPQFAKSKAAQN